MLAHGVQGSLEEVDVAHARDLDRVLEREEHALARPLLGRHGEQVLALVDDAARGHLVAVAPRQHVGEGALARAVRPHDRVDLARPHFEVDAAKDGLVVDAYVQGSEWKASCHSPDGSFEAHAQELLRLDGELHGQLPQDLFAESVDDQVDRVLFAQAALPAVEELVLADARRGRLVLDGARSRCAPRRRAPCGRRTCRRAGASRTACSCVRRSRPSGCARGRGRCCWPWPALMPLEMIVRARVLAQVDHLRAGVGLLIVVRERDRVELDRPSGRPSGCSSGTSR